ncbi:MAG: DUF4194 domain-containing protein [Planctomycetales bacterium]|nr:DUF4194 domain-containing protein [Planctomycetales bacterium]
MAEDREFNLPEFDESSIAAVHLLQGVVYDDEGRIWELVLSHQTRLDSYFGRIGLRLVVNLPEGFAFLRQLEESELDHVRGYDQLPKLFHKKRLSYDATLVCVLLREELRRFEEEVDNGRCVIATDELFEQWKSFFPAAQDEVKSKRQLDAALKSLEELKFIREFTKEPQEWELRRILKARVPVAALEKLGDDLKSAFEGRSS